MTNVNNKKNKKGVSGLIVAVLLVAVSLTIGGLVIGWISGYTSDSLDDATQEQKQQDECFDVDFKVVSVKTNDTLQTIRYQNFNVTIENKNTEDIKGFLFKYIPTSGDSIVTKTNNSAIDAMSDYSRKTYLHHDSMDSGQSSGFSKVEITPIIDVIVDTTVETVCTSKTKVIEKTNYAS